MWRRLLTDPQLGSVCVLLACEGDRLVGFGSSNVQRDPSLAEEGFSAEIGALYVLRTHQRRDIGSRLLARMDDELRHHGHTAAALWVLRENRVARRFY